MNDLRILFAPAADTGHRAQLADARGRRLGVEVPFTPFLTEDDYEDLRWYLEEYMDLPDGGAVLRAERIERNLGDWGSRLYEALFTPPDNRAFLKELLEGPVPRRLTIATRDPALLRLPWELMADAAGSLAQRLSVRRQLEVPEETAPRPAQLPLRILYIVSRPADTSFIDPRFTAKALLDALTPLGAGVRVDFCRPPWRAWKRCCASGRRPATPSTLFISTGTAPSCRRSRLVGSASRRPPTPSPQRRPTSSRPFSLAISWSGMPFRWSSLRHAVAPRWGRPSSSAPSRRT